MKRAKKICSIVFVAFGITLALFALSCLIQAWVSAPNNHGVARIYGASYLYVATDSMEGEREDSFGPGNGICVKAVAPKDLHEGDIVSFYDDALGAVNTHRLVEEPTIEGGHYRFHTKGDNVRSDLYRYEGETFSEEELVGKVAFHSEALGTALSIFSPEAASLSKAIGKPYLGWILPTAIFVFIGGAGIYIITTTIWKIYRIEKEKPV